MIHLFIDSNVYLWLYGNKKKALDAIEKLTNSIREEKITLWLPEQVKNEFERNRETYLNIERDKVKGFKLPPMLGCEDESDRIRHADVDSVVAEFLKKFNGRCKDKSFLADKIINNLFSSAKCIPYDETVIKKAFRRYDLGNPPGKEKSYGDSVIWETLLKDFPEGEDLHFVSINGDFKSKIYKNEISPFLSEEWKREKKSELIVYSLLSAFVKENISDSEISDEMIKEEESQIDIGAVVSRTIDAYKSGIATAIIAADAYKSGIATAIIAADAYKSRIAAMNRVLEDSKLGSMGTLMSALKDVEKEEVTFIARKKD